VDLKTRIRIIQADITALDVDAIVNAANSALMPGGGVDGAIRRKAGHELDEDLYRIGKCPAGQAVITRGYRLPARHVIHTVAPIWRNHASEKDAEQKATLACCYDSTLSLADQYQVRSIAFPAIGTGAYGWPSEIAATIAFERATAHLSDCSIQDCITFCCFTPIDLRAYTRLAESRLI
jgi:O-acetyl-ADP-ribose deacetylase (regulator of RNase III)